MGNGCSVRGGFARARSSSRMEPPPRGFDSAHGGYIDVNKGYIRRGAAGYYRMPSEEMDLIVVGAGPGGLMAANRAAELGLRTLLIEKQQEIGYPVHTSGGTYVRDMEELGIPSRYCNQVLKLTFASSHNEAEFVYSRPETCVLDVRGTYQFLAVEAARRGSQIQLGTTVQGALREGNAVVGVSASRFGGNVQLRSKVVIDASGASAVTNRNPSAGPTEYMCEIMSELAGRTPFHVSATYSSSPAISGRAARKIRESLCMLWRYLFSISSLFSLMLKRSHASLYSFSWVLYAHVSTADTQKIPNRTR